MKFDHIKSLCEKKVSVDILRGSMWFEFFLVKSPFFLFCFLKKGYKIADTGNHITFLTKCKENKYSINLKEQFQQ